MRERRPRFDQHGDEYRPDQGESRHRQRGERALDAPVGPSRRPAARAAAAAGRRCDQWIAIHSELTILRTVRLPGLTTHSMNFRAAPFGWPLVTIQKLRTPPYWPDFA